MTPLCQRCERPSTAYLCTGCWGEIAPDVALLGWLDDQLTVTRSRQARLNGGRRPAGDQPLGYGPEAARAQDQLRNVVTTWARDLDPHGVHLTLGQCVTRLLDQRAVQGHPSAGELARDVEHVRDAALRAINPDEALPTYGPCEAELADGSPCPAYLYGERGADWVRCRYCRTQHETRDRHDWMRRRMEVLYFRAATLARLLPLLIDRPVSASNIRNWWADGRPIRTHETDDGLIEYRCGDVIDVALATPKRKRSLEGSAA